MPAKPNETLEETLNAAYDEHSRETPRDTPAQSEPAVEPPEPRAEDEGPEEQEPSEETPLPEPERAAQGESRTRTSAKDKGNTAAAARTAAPEALKPPADWRPSAKAKWDSLPPEVKEEALRVHKEAKRVLQDSASHRKLAESFTQMVSPFRSIMQGDPLREVEGLLQTAAQLRTASKAHRAAIVAQIIQSFDVPIKELDDILAGEAPTAGAREQERPEQLRDPRFDSFISQLQHAAKQRKADAVQKERESLDAFRESGKAPFLDDVLQEMIHLDQAARSSGKALTLEQLYDKACLINDDVRPLHEQRKAAHAAANATPASTRRPTRVASTSLRSEPSIPPSVKPKSLDDELNDVWESLSKSP